MSKNDEPKIASKPDLLPSERPPDENGPLLVLPAIMAAFLIVGLVVWATYRPSEATCTANPTRIHNMQMQGST